MISPRIFPKKKSEVGVRILACFKHVAFQISIPFQVVVLETGRRYPSAHFVFRLLRLLMDSEIREAFKAHMEWVAQIADRINEGKFELSDLPQIRQNDLCKIGQWLNSLEAEYRDVPEYRKARQAHDDFHRQAATMLEEFHGGDRQAAMQWLLQLGSSEGVSHEMLLSLVGLIFKLEQYSHGQGRVTKGRGWGVL
jgi:hypothetical protein